MSMISFLIKPASSLCNLRCKYCFYADVSQNREMASMGIMQEEVMHALIDKALQVPVDTIHFSFQGGEPTCAGIVFFENFIAYVNKKNVMKKNIQYSMQTNGTLLDEKWIQLLKENDFLVGVSIDGFVKNHDWFRKDAQGKGTHKKILYTLRLLKNAGIAYNILTVLTKQLSKKPEELYRFYTEFGYPYVQIIPCLPSLKGNEPSDAFALEPKEFALFYQRFFDLWYTDFMHGKYMSVLLFDNLMQMYCGKPPQQCGMMGRCSMQMVLEANGDAYPCDFFVLDEYRCGNICTDAIEDMIQGKAAKKFLHEERKMCSLCKTCRFVHMCHGNCKRMNVCYFNDTYCGYKAFLEYIEERMFVIAKRIRISG